MNLWLGFTLKFFSLFGTDFLQIYFVSVGTFRKFIKLIRFSLPNCHILPRFSSLASHVCSSVEFTEASEDGSEFWGNVCLVSMELNNLEDILHSQQLGSACVFQNWLVRLVVKSLGRESASCVMFAVH